MAGVVAEATGYSLEPAWDALDLIHAFLQAPSYHVVFEIALILWIVHLLFTKSYKPERTILTEKEKEDLIESYQPEPLVPEVPEDHPILQNMQNRLVDSKIDKKLKIKGKECLNAASFNFLCMVGRQEIEDVAIKALRKYGVGSCGPRGFFGTVDVHLELEDQLAKFMNCEEAIVYSYGFSTVASAIPAYSKRGDIIFCDDGVCFAIHQGLIASRSEVRYFKHNDMDDLERLLKIQAENDKKSPQSNTIWNIKKAKVTRRFLVVEGLYTKTGDICPLPELVELKEKYKVRIFMDESLSFGTLGKTGRGVTEYFNVPVDSIEMITSSLENTLGAAGGFCCGKNYVIDHQRLSGLGYCFSAATPPMLSQAAITALQLMSDKPELLDKLHMNCRYMHEKLQSLKGLKSVGIEQSPIHLLQLQEPSTDQEDDHFILLNIVRLAQEQGVALTVAAHIEQELNKPPPSIRVAVNCEMTDTEMDYIVTVIQDCAKQEMLT